MTRGGGVVAALVGLVLTLALAAGSRVPWNAHPSQDAQLVLSWRAVSDSRDLCREPTEEDLAGLPSHMRPDRICEESLAEYQLTLTLDGVLLVDRVVRPAGARGDRPIYVLERIPVASGTHRIEVEFVPIESASDSAPNSDSGESAGIELDQTADFESGQVVLVTRDGDRGEFVVRFAGEA
ncbi:MAG: hypothetical protein ACI9OJ_005150 [Myxococcota bacterium]|jgi:hypothetical protein